MDALSAGLLSTEPDSTHVLTGISIADATNEIAEIVESSILIDSPYLDSTFHYDGFPSTVAMRYEPLNIMQRLNRNTH